MNEERAESADQTESAAEHSTEASVPETKASDERDAFKVLVRSSPRYGRFMALGALIGLLGGWLIASLGSSGPWLGTGVYTDTSAVVPFVIAIGAVVGIVLGGIVAVVVDRVVSKRARTGLAERTLHHAAGDE